MNINEIEILKIYGENVDATLLSIRFTGFQAM